MLGRTPSSTRTVIGVGALMAAATIFSPPGSKAQTLAELDVTKQRAQAMAVCDSISNPDLRVGCRGQKSYEFDLARAAAAQKRIEEAKQATAAEKQRRDEALRVSENANVQRQCIQDLTSAILGKRVTREEVLDKFKNPELTTDNCLVKQRLQPRLGELSKQ